MLVKRPAQVRAVTAVSMGLSLGLFFIFVFIGIIMRMNQGGMIKLGPERFYGLMTAHGLGMAASLFIGGYTSTWYLLNKYIRLSLRLKYIVFFMNLLGFIGLFIATVIGNFGPGWYMLYPLPFILDSWHSYTITLIIFSLASWGFAWLFLFLDIVRAISSRYSVANLLGWQYLRKNPTAKMEELPPIVLIAACSCVAGIVAMFSGANLLILYLLKWENLNLDLDPLLLKNMVFLFGHTLVNITLYFCVASIYEILPKYTNRPWKTKKSVVIAWNSSLFFVLTAYLHHLNMDFDQPTGLQFLGQIASYFSVVPATAVTIIGAISQIYKSGIKLSFTPLAFGLGILGWVTGGFAAVVDAGVPVNYTFHNTLWVPAHFHTYFLTGVVFMILGFVHYYAKDVPEKLKGLCKNEGLAKFSLWIMTISGYGFAIMFYISGVAGVPRRFASYEYILLESVKETGIVTGYYAVFFAIIFCVGLLIRYKTYFDKSVL